MINASCSKWCTALVGYITGGESGARVKIVAAEVYKHVQPFVIFYYVPVGLIECDKTRELGNPHQV